MTKKHFQLIALVVSRIEDHRTRWSVTSELAVIFKSINPRFDSEKFRAACNPKEVVSDHRD